MSKWTDERWVAASDDAALEVADGDVPPPADGDPPQWAAERAAYEAMSELANPVAAPGDVDLAAALVATAATPTDATPHRPTVAPNRPSRVVFASVALLAVAAALLLWWGLSGTTLFEQRETGPRELTPDVLDPEPASGEAEVRQRHARRSDEATVAAPPEPEPAPLEAVAPPQAIEAEAPSPKRAKAQTPSPDVLLARARRLRAAHDLAGAERAYRSLIAAHPKSPEAHAARVAAGQVQLKRGRSRAALASFRRYLERGGPLGQEARWGEISALHKLGKTAQRDAAIDALQRRHPKSVFLPMARELQ